MSKILSIFAILCYVLTLSSVECQFDILTKFINFDDNELQLSHECSEHLKIIKNGLENNEIWASKVKDASGNAKSGFVWGNNFWLGSLRACNLLNNPPKIYLAASKVRNGWANLTEIGSKIPLDYRMFYVKHASNIQFDPATRDKSILHIGLCLPKSCNNHESFQMAQTIFHSSNFDESLQLGNILLLSTKTLHIRDNFWSENFVIIFTSILMVFVMINIIGSFYITLKNKSRSKLLDEELKIIQNNHGINTNDPIIEQRLKPNKLEKFCECFSILGNFRFIMSNELSNSSIPSIHGIRSIAMLWIMIGHVYIYGLSTIDNIQFIFAYAEKWILQPIFSAAISVDTFFVISAFLMSYLFFEKQKTKPTKNFTVAFFKSIINRYIRLTPSFMIVMLIGIVLSIVQNDTSQFMMAENIEENCKKYWWRNLLYIQNFYPLTEMCLSWSWYLATDFQLFVFSTMLLILSLKYKKSAVAFAIILVIVSCIHSGYIGYKHAFGFSLDSQYSSIDVLYTTPYSRVGAYMAGLWTGHYLSKVNRQWSLSKISIGIGWFVAVTTTTNLVYVQHFREPNLLIGSLFAAFARTLWAFAICFMILATSMHDSFAANLLKSKFFLPISRMSYAVYLLNPIVLFLVSFGCDISFHLDFYTLFIYTSGFYVMTYIVAFVFMIIFENPILMFIRKFIA
ncbi:unnamed protein product [Diamesa hyperborea]